MIKIGNKEYLNLQEAVLNNALDIELLKRTIGYLGPFESLEDIEDPVAKALYLVGTSLPYSIYQYTGSGYTYLGTFAANGDRGPAGPQGPQGPAGIPGEQGPAGPTGATGATGPEGPQGPRGIQGEPGPTGATGPQGPAGQDGENSKIVIAYDDTTINLLDLYNDILDGISVEVRLELDNNMYDVYQLAYASKNNNNKVTLQFSQLYAQRTDTAYVYGIQVTDTSGSIVWTQTDGVNLKGEKGDTGATGPRGEQGPTGPEGPEGPQGATGPQGPQGIQGIQGEKGEQGEPGETGATGATGPQGEQGPVGATGATGPKGDKGDKGDTGATGPQGPQGEPGPKGDTGATGPQGEQGETGNGIESIEKTSTSGLVDTYTITYTDGDTTTFEVTNGQDGPQGPVGATGPQGPKGDTGDTGATGATGPQGPQGEQGPVGATGPQGPAGQDGLTTRVTVNGSTYYQNAGNIRLPDYPTVPSTSNFVTTDTDQTITGTKTFSSTYANLEFKPSSNSSEVKTGINFDDYNNHIKGYLSYRVVDDSLVLGRNNAMFGVQNIGFFTKTSDLYEHKVLAPNTYRNGDTSDYMVTSINNTRADASGNVTINVPDVSNYYTKSEVDSIASSISNDIPTTATSTSSSSSTSTVTPTTITLTFTYSDNTTENITLMTGASVATTTTTTTTTTLS